MPSLVSLSYAVVGIMFAAVLGPVAGMTTRPVATVIGDAPVARQATSGAAAGASCEVGWSGTSGAYQRSILSSIVASGNNAWAVGLTSDGEDPRFSLAVRWAGDSWVPMPIAQAKTEQALFGLDRSPQGRLWAAGYRAKSSRYYPMMMRWSGTRWGRSGLNVLDDRGGALLGVRALSEAVTWAVGYKVGTAGQRPMAIRRIDGSWREASPVVPSNLSGVLMDIDARSANEAWAVGWAADRGAPRPYIVRWNGRSWSRGGAVLSGSEGVLTSVAIKATKDVWAVGYRVSGGRYRPFVQHWNGKAWRMVAFPGIVGGVSLLRSVEIAHDGSLVVAGTRWDADRRAWRGFAARRKASRWHRMDTPVLDNGSELRDVAPRADGRAWVVGANGSRSVAIDWCPRPQPNDGTAGVPLPPGSGPLGAGGPEILQTGPDGEPTPKVTPKPTPKATPKPTRKPRATQSRAASPEPTRKAAQRPRATQKPKPTPKPTPRRTPRPTPRLPIVAQDVAEDVGLSRNTTSYGAVRADFDRDGWPDLFIGRHSNTGWMLRNVEGVFVAYPGVTIPRRDRHGCAVGDANGDKRMDLYCSTGALHGAGFKGNELWLQRADGSFVERAMPFRATDSFGRGRLALLFDLDHDRRMDLFLGDRPARTDGLPSRNRVLSNRSGSAFVNQSVAGFDAGAGADCLRSADLDRDGWKDIVLCARAVDQIAGYGVQILRNVRGRLFDVTRSSGIAKRQAVDVFVADMDGDRRPDILEVTPSQLRVHLRRGSRYILGYTRSLDHGVAVAAGDVDKDGDRDIYVVQGRRARQRPDLMLLNRGNGRAFRSMPIPQAKRGSAESVTPIDHDRNGHMDFLVLNGKGVANSGPVQLIAFFPR